MRRWFVESDAFVVGLVHPLARADHDAVGRHARFIGSRLAAGAAAFAAMPLALILDGGVSSAFIAIFAGFAVMIAAAFLVSRTGDMHRGCAVSAIGLCLVVVGLWISGRSWAVFAPMLLCLAPMECLVFGARRLLPAVVVLAAATAVVLAGGATEAQSFAEAMSAFPDRAPGVLLILASLGLVGLAARQGGRDIAQVVDERDRQALRATAALGAMAEFVSTHDAQGSVLHVERGLGSAAKASLGDLEGQGLFERVHVADRPAFLKALSDGARGLPRVSATVRLRMNDVYAPQTDRAVFRSFRMFAHGPVAADPNDIAGVGAVAVFVDNSEEVERERRERELQELAQRAGQVKDRFLATVSHELRTPLNAIIGFAEVLSGEGIETLDDDRQREYARIIHKSGSQLLEIVNALLDISKIESGKLEIRGEPFRFEALVSGCVDLVIMQAEQAGIKVKTDIEAGLPEVFGDRRACRQILVNLLSNAVKFTPDGGAISVSARRQDGHIVCAVDDTGVGIPAADLPRLGDPFFRSSNAADTDIEGSGLGLSIVRGLVALISGSMVIESSPGLGTCVQLVIPLDARSVQSPAAQSPLVVRPRKDAHLVTLQQVKRKRA